MKTTSVRLLLSAEKSNKALVNTLNETNKKVEESNLNVAEYENNKRKIAAENADLLRTLQELENSANMLGKIKVQLSGQLDEAKRVCDDEAKERQLLFGKYRNLEHELDGMKDHMDEESCAKDDVLRQLNKAAQEGDMWRLKYEREALAKAEDLEMAKMKMQARLSEAAGTIDMMGAKLNELEKVAVQVDQAHLLNNSMEKKARQFEKVVGEWKAKADGLSMDLDVSQKDCRVASSELFRVKNAYEEGVLQLDDVRKENKLLSNEIKDIMDQISEGGRSIHEIDKIRKRLEAEKMELQAALEE